MRIDQVLSVFDTSSEKKLASHQYCFFGNERLCCCTTPLNLQLHKSFKAAIRLPLPMIANKGSTYRYNHEGTRVLWMLSPDAARCQDLLLGPRIEQIHLFSAGSALLWCIGLRTKHIWETMMRER